MGTRAQICELLKESQYINENISDEKVKGIKYDLFNIYINKNYLLAE